MINISTLPLVLLTLSSILYSCAEDKKEKHSYPNVDSLYKKIDELETAAYSKHKKLTAEVIDTTSDEDLVHLVFEHLEGKFPKDNQPAKESATVASWPKPQQAIYIVQCLDGEVKNGGYNQFYFNSSGQFASLAPAALQLIGAIKIANLTTKANNIYKNEQATITKYQDGTLKGFSKSYKDNPLNKLGDEFFDLYEIENLQKLQADFIRKNKAAFVDK